MAPTTFRLFTKLPPELQLQVWESVEIPASLITVSLTHEMLTDNFDRTSQPCLKFKYRLPAIFHACYTSRMTALRSHPLRFAQGRFGPCFGAPFPFNADKDVLLFTPMETGLTLATNCFSDFKTILRMAIEPGYLDNYSDIARVMVLAFRLGSKLETLYITPSNYMRNLPDVLKKDGTVDYQRMTRALLKRYMMGLMMMELRDQITEEERGILTRKKFCVMSPANLAARFDSPGSLDGISSVNA